jgi:hypothetical protein
MSFDFGSVSGIGAKGELILHAKTSCPPSFPAARLSVMAGTGDKLDSLRLNRFEMKRLVLALVLSLAAHFLVLGVYELGKATGLWQQLRWPERKQLAAKKVSPPPAQTQEDPTMFLDVDADQATPDAPNNTKYYSSRNSHAAGSAAGDSNQPKLNGKQNDVPQTRDVPHTPNTKVQPSPAPQPPTKQQPAAEPKQMLQAGDLKLAKLDTSPEKTEATQERPRTINQALAQQHLQPSVEMRQNGGTRRIAIVPSLDAKETQFGDYDSKFIAAVTQHWYDLLDKFAQDRTGKVTLQFHLNYDGSVSDMEVLQNTVGELLCYVCQEAVMDPAPFEAWPSDMRRMVGKNYREIAFTFYYIDN